MNREKKQKMKEQVKRSRCPKCGGGVGYSFKGRKKFCLACAWLEEK